MKKISKAVCIALTLCLLLSALLALAACDPSNNTGNNHDPQIDAVYQKYVAYAEALGEEPLSYEQWLESVKGPQGDPGDPGKDGATWLVGTETPADTLGKNGDFYLNKTTFELYLKSENTWSSMGVIKGADGDDGDNGKDGTEWFTGTVAPAEELGKAGDFYLNTESYELYKKDETEGWESLGVLANNKQEAAGVSVTIEAGQTATVSLDGVEQGWNTVIVDLGGATLEEGSNLQAYIGDSVKSDFYLSSIRSGDGHTVYFGYINVKENSKEVTLSSAKAVTASVSFEKYNVTIKSGEPFECAVVAGRTTTFGIDLENGNDLLIAKLGDDFDWTKVNDINFSYEIQNYSALTSYLITQINFNPVSGQCAFSPSAASGQLSKTSTTGVELKDKTISFECMDSEMSQKIVPVIITITKA